APRGRLRCSILAGPREKGECGAGLVDLLVVPERLAVAHRLAPVGHGERRIDPLGLPEGVDRIVVLEAVEQQDSADERGLRRGRPGGGKGDPAEVLKRMLRRTRRRWSCLKIHGCREHQTHGNQLELYMYRLS